MAPRIVGQNPRAGKRQGRRNNRPDDDVANQHRGRVDVSGGVHDRRRTVDRVYGQGHRDCLCLARVTFSFARLQGGQHHDRLSATPARSNIRTT
jgi:hypothetical protein